MNASWKAGSNKLSKNKTGCIHADNKLVNLMTEQDLDKLFSKSKEKLKIKTQAVVLPQKNQRSPLSRDYTAIKFLHLEDEYDKMLSGIPLSTNFKENLMIGSEADLTLKFKKDYMVGKVIGEGAYASVRVAIFKPQNRKIAIKAY